MPTLWKRAQRFMILSLAYGGGTGCSPVAPGTVGSLAALAVGYPVRLACTTPTFLSVLFFLTIASIPICSRAARYLNTPDPKSIVLDEFIGMWYSIGCLPGTHWGWFMAAFCLFRFFDIYKPGWIGWVDLRVGGGLGIVLDDVLAGLLTALLLNGLAYALNFLHL